MEHYKSLFNKLDDLELPLIKTNKKIEYINLPAGFDIETTSYKVDEVKTAFMYVWMFGIGHNQPVYYGRTWDEFLEVCEELQARLDLSENKRLVVYVHNLGYEFQFMRKYFNWIDGGLFAVDERKPIKCLCDYGIEFRDSYILSGFSLENTAKNLAKYKVKKMVGDLDYSLIRTHETALTDVEMGYCESDIEVITAYIQEQIELYGDVTKIPMTNTGRVRNFVRDNCYYTSKNHRKSSKSKYIKYRKIMDDLTIDTETYIQLKRSFMGGFTHASANYSGVVLENVSSVDFTSSYPSVMISEQFPMSRFKKCDIKTLDELEKYCSRYAMVFDIKFKNITNKIQHENYISESKCFKLVKPVLNNGRVVSAEELVTPITEVDFDIMKNTYSWDEIEIGECKFAHKNYLPKSIIESILKLYQDKTVLKDVEGAEVEYLLSKGMLNSIYGMCVTDIVKDKAVYNDEWGFEKVNVEEEIENYNNSRKRFLYYAWGIWVTAYARRNLWTGILAAGNDYIYSDTDSLKLLNYDNHSSYIEWFNKQIVDKMVTMCEYYNLDQSLLAPKTKDGKVKMMGVWDFEGTYKKFKTLGAKRYLVLDRDKLKLTVAGLSKQNGIKHMLEIAVGDIDGVFNLFDDTLYIPAEKTGKMTHTYIDNELKFKVTDYNGVTATVNPLSGVHLENCDFTLSITAQYKEFLSQLSKGYIYKGVKHV